MSAKFTKVDISKCCGDKSIDTSKECKRVCCLWERWRQYEEVMSMWACNKWYSTECKAECKKRAAEIFEELLWCDPCSIALSSATCVVVWASAARTSRATFGYVCLSWSGIKIKCDTSRRTWLATLQRLPSHTSLHNQRRMSKGRRKSLRRYSKSAPILFCSTEYWM